MRVAIVVVFYFFGAHVFSRFLTKIIKMGKKKGFKNLSKLPLATDAESGSEIEAMDDLDRYDMEEDRSLMKKLKKTKKKKDNSDNRFVFSLEDDQDSDSALPNVKKKKKKKDDDDMESDMDDEDGEDIDEYDQVRSWGKTKKQFYGGHQYQNAYDDNLEKDDLDPNEAELQESKLLQIKQLEQMDDEDFLDAFSNTTTKTTKLPEDSTKSKNVESIKLDVSRMSKKERLELFKNESPEFFGIVGDFQEKMSEAKDVLQPVVEYINDGSLPSSGLAARYVKTKYSIILK